MPPKKDGEDKSKVEKAVESLQKDMGKLTVLETAVEEMRAKLTVLDRLDEFLNADAAEKKKQKGKNLVTEGEESHAAITVEVEDLIGTSGGEASQVKEPEKQLTSNPISSQQNSPRTRGKGKSSLEANHEERKIRSKNIDLVMVDDK